MVDVEWIRLTASRLGLGKKYVSKEDKISGLLARMSAWDGPDMALKGGTAVNRLYLGDRCRFSEDLDIDIFGPASAGDKVSDLGVRLKRLDGYAIEGPRMQNITARFDAYYENEFGERDRVMLDFRMSREGPRSPSAVRRVPIGSNLFGTPTTVFPCYSLEDLVAHKLIALSEREEGKDLYDLFFILDLEMDESVALGAVGWGVTGKFDMDTGEAFVRDLCLREGEFKSRKREMMNSTNHYIPRSRRPDWGIFIPSVFGKMRMRFGV